MKRGKQIFLKGTVAWIPYSISFFQEKKSPVGSNEDNAVFEQEFLYRESSFCQDIDEDMEFSSCNGATSSSNCSEVTSASYDEASSREDIISDNCLSATRIGKHHFLK